MAIVIEKGDTKDKEGKGPTKSMCEAYSINNVISTALVLGTVRDNYFPETFFMIIHVLSTGCKYDPTHSVVLVVSTLILPHLR